LLRAFTGGSRAAPPAVRCAARRLQYGSRYDSSSSSEVASRNSLLRAFTGASTGAGLGYETPMKRVGRRSAIRAVQGPNEAKRGANGNAAGAYAREGRGCYLDGEPMRGTRGLFGTGQAEAEFLAEGREASTPLDVVRHLACVSPSLCLTWPV